MARIRFAHMFAPMSDERLEPLSAPFEARFSPPGSKSLTNRALVLAAMADGICELSNVLFADDTLVMLEGLTRLGFKLDINRDERRVHVHGRGGSIPSSNAELFCGNSGTTIRFLAALCTLGRGRYALDGIARMRRRPISQLVDLLKNLGGRVSYSMEPGFAPIEVEADGLAGGTTRYPAAQSSQFLSAVLHVCPSARHEVAIDLETPQTSWPYVAMTMRLMHEFGITPELERNPATGDPSRIIVPRGTYSSARYCVEPDASNASYFLAAAALYPGAKITIEGLGKHSLQGDVGFADLLHQMGANLIFGGDFITIAGPDRLNGIDADLAGMPDTAQTLAVVALFADGASTLRGLHTLRVKETDRIAALATELRKLGASIEIDGDDLHIEPPDVVRAAAIDTYDDHRMAMSFSLAALRCEGVLVRDAQCVNKTYPEFFADLRRVVG